ncbi:oligopeptidase A [Bermanella marisrubri]|uniref:oligopeptidase A n=1 Tax=Bermanella marisrubri TaxID=207949 RepID=Q1MZ68_9GAMM|nr:oligopeptidase A [Bermanella marisrubri]EAT11265.1 oligopeptidase A [Oceanobacter sp. RED65] [Bermanella marisrubri]QIZ82747.1 oligopeptidase A [Bermanella marisrubri]
MTNTLRKPAALPNFSEITVSDIEPAITAHLEHNLKAIDEICAQSEFNYGNVVARMEELDDVLGKAWSPVGHLNSVMNNDELREAYNACLPKLSEYQTKVGQNKGLQQAYQAIKDSAEYSKLNKAQKKTIDNALRDFHLGGVDLADDKKQRFGEIQSRLSELSSKFGENLLDATNTWQKVITDVKKLTGVPESALEGFAEAAKQADKEGYLLTLDIPCYLPVMTYCDNQDLRKELYTAFNTRASDQGPNAGEYDNSAIMDEILALRHELAQLLGYESYAHLSLADKMAESPQQVMGFLNDLASKSHNQAKQEFAELEAFAKDECGATELNPWDVPYYGEKLKQARYNISQEDIRPYFPAPKVLNGLFEVVRRLFNVDVEAVEDAEVYHPDVTLYSIKKDGKTIAQFYLDLYARAKKRGGAWMDECRVRRVKADGELQIPVAYLVCNFTPPVGDKPALLTHDEVETLFHEFGHGIHHMLTQVDTAAVSGINGVAWDAVELPSQFMENWCWEPEALAFISGHVDTGEPLPQDMLDKMLAAKHFQSAMMMVRQLEFSLFDFRIHMEFNPDAPTAIQDTLNEVRQQVAVMQPPEFNRFQHGFGHIFAGGYAAGYYSYKWAEVLSADAYSRFEDEGIFNQETGKSFFNEILSRGGEDEASVLFENFRGREPSVEPLLRHSGIKAA